MTPLSTLTTNDVAEITSINDEALAKHLLTLGCAPGERIMVQRKALFGDPIIIKSGGALLSLRKADASVILVKKID